MVSKTTESIHYLIIHYPLPPIPLTTSLVMGVHPLSIPLLTLLRIGISIVKHGHSLPNLGIIGFAIGAVDGLMQAWGSGTRKLSQ